MQSPTRSPPNPLVGDGDATKKKPAAKKINQRAKLDAARLLAEDGLPALRRHASKFKFKGKGHEAGDLSRMILMFQLWAHNVFPSLSLSAFIDATENLCRKGTMKVAFEQMKRNEIAEVRRERERLAFDDVAIHKKTKTSENGACDDDVLSVDGGDENVSSSKMSASSKRRSLPATGTRVRPLVIDDDDDDSKSVESPARLFSDGEDDMDFDTAINNAFNIIAKLPTVDDKT